MGRGSNANDSVSYRDTQPDSLMVRSSSEGMIQKEIAEFTVIEFAHGVGQKQFEDSNSHLAIHRLSQFLVKIRDSDVVSLAENPQSEFCGFPIPGLKNSNDVQDIRGSEPTLLQDTQSLQGGNPLQDFTGRSASQANELEKGKRLTRETGKDFSCKRGQTVLLAWFDLNPEIGDASVGETPLDF